MQWAEAGSRETTPVLKPVTPKPDPVLTSLLFRFSHRQRLTQRLGTPWGQLSQGPLRPPPDPADRRDSLLDNLQTAPPKMSRLPNNPVFSFVDSSLAPTFFL